MKSLYAFIILWTFFTAAKGLDCQTCLNTADPQCTTEASVTCATETMCVTATTQVNLGGSPSTTIIKRCAPPTICGTVGPLTVTLNAGLSNIITSAECCDTDNCNTATLAAPTRNTTTNGLECNFCLPNTELCNIIVGCEGNENSCFQGTVTGGPIGDDILGCGSANLCDAPPSIGTQLFQVFGTITGGPTCCNTPFCNERSIMTSPSTATTMSSPTTPMSSPTSAMSFATTAMSSPTSVTAGSDGATTTASGGGGGSVATTNSSPVLSCALLGPVGVIVMIFISTLG